MTDIRVTRGALADWSAPIIADLLSELYARRLGVGDKATRLLVLTHSRLWRLLILDHKLAFEEGRAGVCSIAQRVGLEPGLTDEMDLAVLRDLSDVAITRFLRSPERLRAYSELLLDVAASLAEARLVSA